jgi:PKHD-type hydroxylase
MMIRVPSVLDGATVAHCRELALAAPWVDGDATAGAQSALAKRNIQLPEGSEAAQAIGRIVLGALGRAPQFVAAALPLKIYPPLVNRYRVGDRFGTHIDNAIRFQPGSDFRIRTDLSATLFLSDPDSYDGGDLVVEDELGVHSVRLPAGDMVLYPATSLHHVTEVRRGERLAVFFWMQSMVRDDGERRLLFELDSTVQSLARTSGQSDPAVVRLTGIYHNLLRRWADC